ncbi:hypothetical protein HYW40_01600 [Candidatus Curtissbacteria bacterium]|nr:hypothetical protein [Candidatus Curtissbacteria bacterium]
MNPKQFLTIGGAVLVLVAILGYIGIIGPTMEQSIFGEAWYFDNGENVAHLVLGVVALGAAFLASAGMQKMLTMLVALVALFFGLYGFIAGPGPANTFGLANLENPLDNVLHLAIAAWAGYVSWMKK